MDEANVDNSSVAAPAAPSTEDSTFKEPEPLQIGDGPTWGKLVSLNPLHPSIELRQNSVVFGRTPALCQVTYNTPTVSGKHCKLYRDPATKQNIVFLEDTSTNGTFINKELIGKGSKILVNNGCEISIIPKQGPERISFIYQDCSEEKAEIDQGGPQPYYDLREVLGTGNFASVRLAIHKETGQKYALKIIDKKKMSMTSKRKDALMDEVNVLTKVKNENIISIKEVFETNKNLYLVLELVTGGELFDKIVAEQKFTEPVTRYVMRQICNAVQYLHHKGIAHRDLKPENILLAKPDNFIIKISDFGLSRALDEGSYMKTMCGTPQYVAPEILTKGEREGYGKSVDLWSIGVIMYILLCGFPPFGDPSDTHFFDKVKRGGFSFPSPYWDSISDQAKDLISNLILVDVEKRLTIDQTLAHPWFSEHTDDIDAINNVQKESQSASQTGSNETTEETTTTTTEEKENTNSQSKGEVISESKQSESIKEDNEPSNQSLADISMDKSDEIDNTVTKDDKVEVEEIKSSKKRYLSDNSYEDNEQDLKKVRNDQ